MSDALDRLIINNMPMSDAELLSTRPGTSENVNMDFEPIPLKLEPLPVESIVEDIVKHPSGTAYMVSQGLAALSNPAASAFALADVMTPARQYLDNTALKRYLPEMGSPYELLRHLDEHPEDWEHLLPFKSKLNDMIENPEEYTE